MRLSKCTQYIHTGQCVFVKMYKTICVVSVQTCENKCAYAHEHV